jgi:hypothetical protein
VNGANVATHSLAQIDKKVNIHKIGKTAKQRVERSLCTVALGWVEEEGGSITEDAIVDISIFDERVGVMPFTVKDENYSEKGGDEEDVGERERRVKVERREFHQGFVLRLIFIKLFAHTSLDLRSTEVSCNRKSGKRTHDEQAGDKIQSTADQMVEKKEYSTRAKSH